MGTQRVNRNGKIYGTQYVTDSVVKQLSAYFLTVTQRVVTLPPYKYILYGVTLPTKFSRTIQISLTEESSLCTFGLSTSDCLSILQAGVLYLGPWVADMVSEFLMNLLSKQLLHCGTNSKSSGHKLCFRDSHVVLLKLLVEPRFSCSRCGYGIIWLLYVDDRADWFLPLHSSLVPKLMFSFLLILL